MSYTHSRPAAVFTPEAVASINRAFAEAVDIIGDMSGRQELRLKLAEHMMSLARSGEVDERRLCSLSVLAVLGSASGRERVDGARHRSDKGD